MDVKALFVDAAGTLLRPREPIGVTYTRFARLRGHEVDPVEVEHRFRAAMKGAGTLPQQGDGRQPRTNHLGDVTVGVDEAEPLAALAVLPGQVHQECGLARPGLSDHVHVEQAIRLANSEDPL